MAEGIMKKAILFCVFLVLGCSKNEVYELEKAGKIDVVKALQTGLFRVAENASLLTVEVIKDEKIPVKASLNLVGGTMDLQALDKLAELSIDVMSFDSGLLERDFRVTSVFFGNGKEKNPPILLKINPLSPETVSRLRSNQKLENIGITGDLSFNNVSIPFSTQVNAGFTDKGRFFVENTAPILVRISSLNLSENLKRLMELCGHKSVSDEVKVGGHFEFIP